MKGPQGTTYAVALDAASPSYDPKVWVYENGGWLPETEKFYSFMFRIQLAVPKKEFSIESMSDDELKSLARQAGFRAGTISYMDGEGQFPFIESIGDNCLVELRHFARLVADRIRKG